MTAPPIKRDQERGREQEIRRLQANLDDENDGVRLYQALAQLEPLPERRRLFERLSQVEARHADVWRRKLREAGAEPQERGPGWKVRLAIWLARRFGVAAALPVIRSLEAGAYATYMAQDRTARALAPDEAGHQATMARLERAPVLSGRQVVFERWHRTASGGVLRAAVFGVNDGLVSNTALVMGFAGAQVAPDLVLLAGTAGLLAGAFSMGVGEYVSVTAQRELLEHQIEIEKRELASAPEEELNELAAIYEARGLPAGEAQALAQRLLADPSVALDVLIKEELGIEQTQLGSAWGAASGSFLAFAAGALAPVAPFFFARATDLSVIALSAALSAGSLFLVGASLSLFTGRHPVFSGLRQLGLGAAAAALTYAVGSVLGVSLG